MWGEEIVNNKKIIIAQKHQKNQHLTNSANHFAACVRNRSRTSRLGPPTELRPAIQSHAVLPLTRCTMRVRVCVSLVSICLHDGVMHCVRVCVCVSVFVQCVVVRVCMPTLVPSVLLLARCPGTTPTITSILSSPPFSFSLFNTHTHSHTHTRSSSLPPPLP